MSDPVVELVETLKAVRLEVAAIGQKIDTKAATPAQLAELSRAVKSADPAELASCIATAAVQAGQKIAREVRGETEKLSTATASLTTHDTNLDTAIKSIAATGEAIRKASFWLIFAPLWSWLWLCSWSVAEASSPWHGNGTKAPAFAPRKPPCAPKSKPTGPISRL
uniref:hypothetical protein n=1 Tax=Acidiphilium multivorum TaxID=62140 RepID=UPI00155DD389|nr:hypothetical protein [Acidiphilium multivorum]